MKENALDFETKSDFMEDCPVDIVYLWCNSSDEEWLKKKNNELKKYKKSLDEDAVGNCRFIDNNELKYSLRSLEKYAKWINNIFIVTDNQVPKWLDTNNPKIHIVNHCDILPPEALPTFNASAIETVIHKIPNLSEYFLFANDDMFFGNYVEKSFFYNKDKLPIFRFINRRIINKKYNHLYGHMISTAYKLIKEKYGKTFPYFPHHNIDAYRKSDIEKCYNDFKDLFEQTAKQKFREKDCVQRSILGYYSIAKSLADCKIVNSFSKKILANLKIQSVDSFMFELKASKLKLLDRLRPSLFCLNDSLKTNNNDRLAAKYYLENRFPEPSQFEKPTDKTAQILVCYHKKFSYMKNEICEPIQVGAEISDVDLEILKDNIGDNISSKNKNYCELTALYWLWKNSEADYKGLMHYRRLFDLNNGKIRWFNKFPENLTNILHLNLSFLEFIFEDFDIILPMKRVIQKNPTVYEHYKNKHYISDLDKVLNIIEEKNPQMYETAVEVLKKSKEIYLYNMFISSKEFFNNYAQWLFSILFELEKDIKTELGERNIFQQRVYGFISERLLTIYVEYYRKQGLKIKEVPVVYCETNKKRYNIFQTRTNIYKILTKIGIRRPHWKEQYGV